jgi:hypothetical protein
VKLKIKITIPDDRKYRETLYPYDIREGAIAADIDTAIRNALDAMQRLDATEASASVKYYDNKVGTVKVKLEDNL